EADNGVQVNVQVTHLEEGSYGIHIHDKGVCEPPSFESAGDHFNPDDRKHGFYNQEGPHKGDMENLKVDEDGEADQMYMNEFVTLKKENQIASSRKKEQVSLYMKKRMIT